MKQVIYVVGLVLIMTSCMTTENIDRSSKDSDANIGIEFELCFKNIVYTQACHAGRCHAGTIYIDGCDVVDIDNLCDSLTVDYAAFNSSHWHNTTCSLTICIESHNQTSTAFSLQYQSCTNNVCGNGTSEISISESSTPTNFNAPNIHNRDDYFNIPCVNLLYSRYKRARFAQKINEIKHL